MLFETEDPIRVCITNEDWDVYIGRGNDPKTGEPGIWGNPYTTKDSKIAKYKVKTKQEAIENYRKYLLSNEFLMSMLETLKGKRLGCWCKHKKTKIGEYNCHGEVIIEEFRNLKYKYIK